MDIAIHGATGRVGTRLIKQILASDPDRLVGAYVSANSHSLGQRIDDTDLVYEEAGAAIDHPGELIIDFSTPAATIALLDNLSARTRALVIGTTGFTQDEECNIESVSRHFPIMMGANFADGFEPFVAACRELAAAYPDEVPQLEETYHERKKAAPSGTSLRLAREIADARKQAGCEVESEIPIKVNREGNVTGEHSCRVDLDQYNITIDFSVNGLDAYARGAVLAAQWLRGRANGLYAPVDMLRI